METLRSPATSYEDLAALYRQQVLDKLPPSALLSPAFLAGYPLGSDVSKVPETCGVLSVEQISITHKDATELVRAIAAGALTAEEVTLAFGLRAALAHQLTTCLTDFFLDEALEQARKLDQHFARTGQVVGPLHGLPISLKDQVTVKGHITSCSFLALHHSGTPSPTDAHLVKILSTAGAIFYCHTTLPQTIMHLECESFWGRTLNPFNTSLTPGGSSGGEGALLGMRGSPLGIGTDIGGSVRSPAANCGLYGYRATAQRVPNGGVKTYVPGRDSILGVPGPMAHSLRDIELFLSVVLGEETRPWVADPALLELAWGVGRRGEWEEGRRKLRVGVMRCDGEVRPLKPMERAVENVVRKLVESGRVEVVEFVPWKTREGWELARKLYFVDGGKRIRNLLDEVDEPLHPLSKWLLEEAGEPVREASDIHRLWEINMERDAYRAGFAAHWNSQDVDVLLTPAAPGPAPKHGESKWWAYTSHWNVVDYPAVAIRTGLVVDPALDSEAGAEAVPFLSADDELLRKNYNVQDYRNAPLAVQFVARRYHDEELMAAVRLVESIIA